MSATPTTAECEELVVHTDRQHIMQVIETGGPGGAERVLVNLAEAVGATPGYRASIGLLKEGWLAGEVRSRGIEIHMDELQRVIDPAFLRRLVRRLRAEQVALLHAHEFTMNLYGTWAARLAGVPVVATVHGKHYYADAERRVWAMRSLPKLGAVVVAVSSDIQRFLESELGVRPVRVIPNGIDVGRYRQTPGAAVRAGLGLPGDAHVVGAVGNLYKVKGHATLIDAVAALDDPRVHIVIAGRGEEEAALRERAAAAGIGERLHLLGFRDDVPALLGAFDVYALPSFSEGQSLALIEAMAATLPIVASRVGGNPEIIDDGEDGLLVPAGEPGALAAALRRMLSDRPFAGRLAAGARARAEHQFSLEAMVGRYLALYAELGVRIGA